MNYIFHFLIQRQKTRNWVGMDRAKERVIHWMRGQKAHTERVYWWS